MFRLFRGELKKTFGRVGIYVMTGLLAAALFFTAFLYTPTKPVNTLLKLDGAQNTVTGMFAQFNGGTEDWSQAKIYEQFEDALNYVENYATAGADTVSNVLSDRLEILKEKISGKADGSIEGFTQKLTALIAKIDADGPQEPTSLFWIDVRNTFTIAQNAFKNLYDYYMDEVKATVDANNPSVYITKSAFDSLNALFTEIKDGVFYSLSSSAINDLSVDTFVNKLGVLSQGNKITAIGAHISTIKSVVLPVTVQIKITDFAYETSIPYIEAKALAITAFVNSINSITNPTDRAIANGNTANRTQMNKLITEYDLAVKTSSNLIYNQINYEQSTRTFKINTDATVKGYMGFSAFNSYKLKETITMQKYLVKNNKTSANFLNVFNFDNVISPEQGSSAFDFMYYALEIISILLIAFAVVIAASMVASEYSGNTMKMLAIRPYNRRKILSGKLLATIFFVFAFVLLAVISTYIIGINVTTNPIALFSSQKILTTFGGGITMTVTPFVYMLLYVCVLFLKVMFYVIIAFTLAVLTKSNILSTIIAFILLFLTSMLGTTLATFGWYKFLPFANFNFGQYIGLGTTSLSSNYLANLTTQPIIPDSSLLIAGISAGGFAVLLLIATFVIFRKRDIE